MSDAEGAPRPIEPHPKRYIVVTQRANGFEVRSVRRLPDDDEPPEWLSEGTILNDQQLVEVSRLGYGMKGEGDNQSRRMKPIRD